MHDLDPQSGITLLSHDVAIKVSQRLLRFSLMEIRIPVDFVHIQISCTTTASKKQKVLMEPKYDQMKRNKELENYKMKYYWGEEQFNSQIINL